jgi:hypothetical protein
MRLVKSFFLFLTLCLGTMAPASAQVTCTSLGVPGNYGLFTTTVNELNFAYDCYTFTGVAGGEVSLTVFGDSTAFIEGLVYSPSETDYVVIQPTSWSGELGDGVDHHLALYIGGQPGSVLKYMVNISTSTQPIPEPSTYALMLVGLAAVGLAAKRRRERQFLFAH